MDNSLFFKMTFYIIFIVSMCLFDFMFFQWNCLNNKDSPILSCFLILLLMSRPDISCMPRLNIIFTRHDLYQLHRSVFVGWYQLVRSFQALSQTYYRRLCTNKHRITSWDITLAVWRKWKCFLRMKAGSCALSGHPSLYYNCRYVGVIYASDF